MRIAAAPVGHVTGAEPRFVPIGLVFSVLYAGLHYVVWVASLISERQWSATVYDSSTGFRATVVTIGGLLAVYLAAELQRQRRLEPTPAWVYVAYPAALVLVLGVAGFLLRTAVIG